jgi:hypothetical protein
VTVDELYEALTSPEVAGFLSQEKLPNPQDFLLHTPGHLQEIKAAVADQLISQSKAAKKLPFWSQKKSILWPPPLSIEQASSEITAWYKAQLISGEHLIDLTGGSGVDCLEMGRKFKKVTYVEQDDWLVRLFAHNARLLAEKPTKFERYQKQAEQSLDLITDQSHVFLDPARRDSTKKKVFRIEDCSPDLNKLLPKIRAKCKEVVVKLSPMLDLSEGVRQLLPYEIHVVAINNECKELLFRINSNPTDDPKIVCVNFKEGKWETFYYNYEEEAAAESEFGPIQQYLYEPNAAILKSGAFNLLGKRCGLKKLAKHTHLYTSTNYQADFPGRIFSVIKKNISGKDLKESCQGSDLHVITRNYPFKADELKKKYKLTERGSLYIIGYTDLDNKKKMVLVELKRSDQT